MKGIKKVFAIFFCTFLLIGCSTPKEEGPATDEDFILNVSKALETRWNKTDNVDDTEFTTSELQKHYTEIINLEKEQIGDLSDYEFQDEELKTIAESYVEGLNLQENGIKYVGTDDYQNYENTWVLGYNYRVCAIHDLNTDFGLTVSSKYKTTLDDVLAEYTVSHDAVTLQEYVNGLSEKIDYKKNDELSDEWTTYYSAVVENTTEISIDSLQVQIDFLDANGVSIYQGYDSKNNIEPGAKIQSDVFFDNSKGQPVDMKITITAYNQ